MRSVVLSVVVVMSLLVSAVAEAATARVGTWNLMRLGDGDKKAYASVASIAANVDLLAIQEVMNTQGLDQLKAALEQRTHEQWTVLASSPVGSAGYKEMYAFIYRNSAVQYEEGAVSYLDREKAFVREPFSARFRSRADNSDFVMATVHILYGKSAAARKPELQALANYWTWLEQVYPGQPILLTGDFNMPPTDAAFNALRAHAKPLVNAGASTLSAVDGRFASLYDNVWVSPASALRVSAIGIVDYPKMLGLTHAKARQVVSDHAPVFFQLGAAQLDKTVVMTTAQPAARAQAANDSNFSTHGATLATADSATVAGPVRGNRNSHVYHRAQGCPSYASLSAKNRVDFASEQEAQAQGYRLAGNCR